MKDNEIALQSQQLLEQTGNRQARALEQQGQAWSHLPDMVTGFQQAYARSQQIDQAAQAHQMDMAKGASSLALDELRRKQAMEELQWTAQLHSTDMMEMDKKQKIAQTRLIEAQTDKAISDLNHDPNQDDWIRLDPATRRGLIKSGMMGEISGGKFVLRPSTEQDIANADAEEQKANEFLLQKATAGSEIAAQGRIDAERQRAATAKYEADLKDARDKYEADLKARVTEEVERQRAISTKHRVNTADAREPTSPNWNKQVDPATGDFIEGKAPDQRTPKAPAVKDTTAGEELLKQQREDAEYSAALKETANAIKAALESKK